MEQEINRKSQNRANAQTLRTKAKAGGRVSFQTYLTRDEIDEVKLLIAKMRSEKPSEANVKRINEFEEDSKHEYDTAKCIREQLTLIVAASALPQNSQSEVFDLVQSFAEFYARSAVLSEKASRLRYGR